jgi:hypothetical protein
MAFVRTIEIPDEPTLMDAKAILLELAYAEGLPNRPT